MRVMLFVQNEGDKRPKVAGEAFGSDRDGPRHTLRFTSRKVPELSGWYFTGATLDMLEFLAVRWWLVECESAEAGRSVIAKDGWCNGRILGSGGRS